MQRTIIALGIAALLWGCANQEGSPKCIEGKAEQCACPGGELGTQTCTAEGKYGPCQCTPAAKPTDEEDPRAAEMERMELQKQIDTMMAEINEQEEAKREAEEALAEAKTDAEKLAAQARRDAASQRLNELLMKAPRKSSDKTVNRSADCLNNPLGC